MSINSYYTRPWIFKRYCIGPIAPHLVPFSKFLEEQGYSYATGQRYVREVGHLSRWLDRQGGNITELSDEIIGTYLCYRYQGNQVHVKNRPYRLLFDYLQQAGIACMPKTVVSPLDICIAGYQEHMVKNQGLAKETIRKRIQIARNFLLFQFGEQSLDFSDLLPHHIEQFFLNRSTHCNTTTLKTETSALLCFLRFLQFSGHISSYLVDSVPTVASWRHMTIPEFLTSDEIKILIQNCECETPKGQRDIAILLLLIRLGLRAIEICRLTLDDIDWNAGIINILGKSGKQDSLPLLHDVGKAISNYLCSGRPQCSTRYVFVRTMAPYRPLACSSSVANVVRNALIRANINPVGKGSHLLRRSLATMMLHKGASLAEIGQILRHQNHDTTAIYAKVDHGRLRPLTREWPKGGGQ